MKIGKQPKKPNKNPKEGFETETKMQVELKMITHRRRKIERKKRETCDSSMDNSAILELNGHRFVVQFHQKPVQFSSNAND